MSKCWISFLLLFAAWGVGPGSAGEVDLKGEAALSLITSDIQPNALRADLRYQPDLTVTLPLGSFRSFTAFASGEAIYESRIVSFDQAEGDGDLSLYRLWLRYGSGTTEVRAGRQKLSFGSATLLRPLMWFDNIDPRDPLKITSGVDGLLLRFYFANNANIWLWGLYGNEDPKGWEIAPTLDQEAEYGGRIQWPLGSGELAASYHHRRADLSFLVPAGLPSFPDTAAPEDRFGLDGKWDVALGVWFEAVVVHQRSALAARPFRRFICIGADYTFGLGEGLTILTEHMTIGAAQEAFGSATSMDNTAASLRYPWGVVDEFGLILNYDWESGDLYSFLEWRRNQDHWSFHLMGFANPAEPGSSLAMQGSDLLAGRGVRLLLAFNH
jgi:hypothetical protein